MTFFTVLLLHNVLKAFGRYPIVRFAHTTQGCRVPALLPPRLLNLHRVAVSPAGIAIAASAIWAAGLLGRSTRRI